MVDERRQQAETMVARLWRRRPGAASALALVAVLHGCHVNRSSPHDAALLPVWQAAIGDAARTRCWSLDPSRADGVPPAYDPATPMFVVDESWRLPDRAPDADVCDALRAFVDAGGTLVLWGHAARIVHALGVEPEPPESVVYRWGFDARARSGRADLHLAVVSGREPELFDGLEPGVAEHAFAVAGGTPCTTALCAWRIGEPKRGQVLARFGALHDGEPEPLGAPVLVQWQLGRGRVLCCGLVPSLEHEDEVVRRNASTFVGNVARWARGRDGGELVVQAVPLRGGPTFAPPRADGPPIVPWLAHWGWQASLYDDEAADAARPPAELVDQTLVESWRAGADLLELELTDAQHGAPIAWSPRDPVVRPASWRGNPLEGAWGGGGFRVLADEAHARGMLMLGGLDPLPVGERPAEQLVALRRHARELADVRRLGAGAFDGFGIRQWWQDPRGLGVAMVHDYQPGAVLYCAGERTPTLGGALRALDADDGAPRGLPFAGVSEQWRGGFPGDLFPLGVLDARARSDAAPGAGVVGGGSFPDWLVAQWNAFVRERRLAGGAALWRRHDPRTLGDETAGYVHGLGMEPLRAAVATPLSATGEGGLRRAAEGLLGASVDGFDDGPDAAAPVHVLQNNWFRLLGSGGALAFDPQGLARFGDEALILSPGFLRTRLFGARPDRGALDGERVDFLAHGYRGEGGYGAVARVGTDTVSEARVPALLGRDQEPRWPAAVDFEWSPRAGYHELSLQLRSDRGPALVGVWLDTLLLRCVACPADARVPEQVIPVHVARAGPRRLRVEVLEGEQVAIDQMRLRRAGDVAVEAHVTVPAGSCAQLVERSDSSYHHEQVTLTTLADLAGFVVGTRCERAARNLQVERRLALPRHRVLVASSDGDERRELRSPFVLGAEDADTPDLVVVPLHLPRYEHFVVGDGELLWRSAPEAGLSARVGFLVCRRGSGADLLPHAVRICEAVDRPLSIELGVDGAATLATDLPVAWNRLLHIERDVATPFLVRERGWWTWRAAQPAPNGGLLLRVWQDAGDVVEVVGGAAALARTRPGPGALRVVALRDPMPDRVDVRVLQRSRLAAPSVILGADFHEVLLDGEPWSWFDGRTVFLPDAPGDHRVETKRLVGEPRPHVRRTAAPLVRCAYDPTRRQLVLETAVDSGRPPSLPYTAWLGGPRPTAVENGALVETDELQLADAAERAAAERGGTVIRFRPGTTIVRYGDDAN